MDSDHFRHRCTAAWIAAAETSLSWLFFSSDSESVSWILPAARLIAHLPEELLQAGSNRTAATRLQAFMGNDPRLKESGQWKGQTKMSKRGVEILRTSFFQAAFSASVFDSELKAFYRRKRAQGKPHQVALSHLMRILTRRLVAVLRSGQPYRPKELVPLQNAA